MARSGKPSILARSGTSVFTSPLPAISTSTEDRRAAIDETAAGIGLEAGWTRPGPDGEP